MIDNDRLEPLLDRVALRDRQAFRHLYDASAAHLLAVALRILKSRAQAEEALQDGFVQIWQNATRFDKDKARASTWMTSIVRYRALDMVRRQGREQSLDEMEDGQLPPAASIEQSIAGEPRLQPCLEELGEQPRNAVILAFVDGYSHQELSEQLGKPLGTVKSWIRRGLTQLKECLER